jgi:hypothetical protein
VDSSNTGSEPCSQSYENVTDKGQRERHLKILNVTPKLKDVLIWTVKCQQPQKVQQNYKREFVETENSITLFEVMNEIRKCKEKLIIYDILLAYSDIWNTNLDMD